MTSFSVVIPAYDEADGIADIVRRVVAVEPALRDVGIVEFELLVVDDGSRDETGAIVREMARSLAPLRLICHSQNGGYGKALKTGFREAKGELIGFLDADGTYPPEHFPALCRAALDGAELVIGSRMAGSDSHMPRTRRIGNLFFANLLSLMGRQRVTDSASGMRVFHRHILHKLYPLPDGLNLTPIMSTRAIHEQVAIVELPIPYSERVGRSKLSVVKDGRLFLYSMLWTVMKYNPVRVLGLLGVLGVAVGALVALWIVALRLAGVTTLGPWSIAILFGGAIAGFAGVSLLSLGAIFNYLVALFHKQPMRQGLFGRRWLPELHQRFNWFGVGLIAAGGLLGGAALTFGAAGWEMARLWFYFMISGMLVLIGIQLFLTWVLLQVLDELSRRDGLIDADLLAQPVDFETTADGKIAESRG